MRANEESAGTGNWQIPAGNASELSTMGDEPIERGGKQLREYVAMLRRRKVLILFVSTMLIVATFAVSIALPPVYRSSATIWVQEQEVPPDLVRSTITSFADERIQVISQQVMTRAVLQELIDKYNLYPRERAYATSDELVERIRKDIKLTTIDANVSDRSSGRRVNATIAFKISFDSQHPASAQNVVNDLVTQFLNENVSARQQSVAETSAFLAQESERAAVRIREIEANLSAFKRRNTGRTPDSSAVNLQLAERTDADLMRVERDISFLQERKRALDAQIALVNPDLPALPSSVNGERALTPADRLRTLQAQYASTSAVYGADHPDLRRLQREISALKSQVGTSVNEEDSSKKLEELEAQLAALKDRYADNHPDLQRLRRSIAALKVSGGKDVAKSRSTEGLVSAPSARPDNPAYIALTTQIENTKRELAQLTALREDLRTKQRAYDARLMQMPEVEREFRELTRDYENTQARYREIRAKEMQAQVSQELEKDRKAERFSVGEPANLPQTPISPKRAQIALLGFLGSLGGGIGLAWLRDALDPSVKGPLELARIAPVPILTAIPYIATQDEQAWNRRRARVAFCLALGLGIGLVVAVHSFWKPLPALLDGVLRRVTF
jgi:uncharacterized protein involved in exopolysaccharide biosynthesis